MSLQYTQIEGKVSLEQATKGLVHLAKLVQQRHTPIVHQSDTWESLLTAFEIRKRAIIALMDLIEEYIYQLPHQ